jgi:hypothetical protein
LHNSELKEAIIKVIAYFDTQNIYLTHAEIIYYLHELDMTELSTFSEVLQALIEEGTLRRTSGYYVFADISDEAVMQYKERFIISWQKIRDAYPYLWVLSLFPFVRGIAIGNTVAMYNAHEQSDVDLVIFTSKKFLWVNRFLITVCLRIFKLRPEEGGKIALCPSFFLSDEGVSLTPVQIKDDIYLHYWLHALLPVYGLGGVMQFRAANGFNTMPNRNLMYEIDHSAYMRYLKKAVEILAYIPLSIIGRMTYSWQQKRIAAGIQAGNTQSVVANDTMIKLHYDDAREDIRNEWIKRYEPFLTNN